MLELRLTIGSSMFWFRLSFRRSGGQPLPLKLSLGLSMHEPMLSLSLSMNEPMPSLSMLVMEPNHADLAC